MDFIDTHCHIHESDQVTALSTETARRYKEAGWPQPDDILDRATAEGVRTVICVGTTVPDSELAVAFAQNRPNVHASIGIHPYEAKVYDADATAKKTFAALATQPDVVAIGECGLDFFRQHSPRAQQESILRFQIELALKHNLPMIFHVRNAFEAFWPIFDSYKGIRGVIHSFSATTKELDAILARGLFVGLNGIMTFTKDPAQLEAARAVPLDKMVLETDAPFLTPHPFRSTMCESKHVRVTAEFLAGLRGESLAQIAASTTQNARAIFNL